jgi:hypothetical protein
MTVVDREPRGLTGQPSNGIDGTFACGVGSSSQGLYVVPEDACFPLNSPIESFVFIIFVVIIAVILSAATYLLVLLVENQSDLEVGFRIRLLTYLIVVSFGYSLLGIIDIVLLGGIGVDLSARENVVPNATYVVVFLFHAVSVSAPFAIYTLPLLPDWRTNTFGEEARQGLQIFIHANWRRARLLTTLALTGAVGTTIPFVFSQIRPNFFFVLTIVGSIAIGPLGIVWFLMRRIREAEKELYPT